MQGEMPMNPTVPPPPLQMHPSYPPPHLPLPMQPASYLTPLQPPQCLPQIQPSQCIPQFQPPQPLTQPSATFKRRREGGDQLEAGDTVESAAKRAKAQDVIYRIVVPSKQIGKVIGKSEHRIQRIREDTKATIKIAGAIVRHEERVIIISSKGKENEVTEAENALHQIAHLILKEDDNSSDPAKAGVAGADHVAANTIKLLIAGCQAGCLIGMSGQNIEKLRTSSGATFTVLSPNQLPLCASALESDRVVQVSGDICTVLEALVEIGRQLRENPPRQVISLSPVYNYSLIRTAQPYVDPTSADYVTFEMLISEAMVGGLIGRSGSNISRIRSETGAMIKVYGGKGEQKHRHIQFGGSAQQLFFEVSFSLPLYTDVDRVAFALQRVDEYIYSQYLQQAGSE